jgi:hypothetical protein
MGSNQGGNGTSSQFMHGGTPMQVIPYPQGGGPGGNYPTGLSGRGSGGIMEAPHGKYETKKESAFKSYQ